MLDTSLHHQTTRMARAEKRREYRNLHRNSEMQCEDEKKKAKARPKVGFMGSSTSFIPEESNTGTAGGDPGALESSSDLRLQSSNEE